MCYEIYSRQIHFALGKQKSAPNKKLQILARISVCITREICYCPCVLHCSVSTTELDLSCLLGKEDHREIEKDRGKRTERKEGKFEVDCASRNPMRAGSSIWPWSTRIHRKHRDCELSLPLPTRTRLQPLGFPAGNLPLWHSQLEIFPSACSLRLQCYKHFRKNFIKFYFYLELFFIAIFIHLLNTFSATCTIYTTVCVHFSISCISNSMMIIILVIAYVLPLLFYYLSLNIKQK